VFENILYQHQIVHQIKTDLESGTLAPSILFSGPRYAGKGTTALELARVLSCEDETNRGSWTCGCASCVRHRNLILPDMLLLGKRRFFVEIAASGDTFLHNPENHGSRMLFLRSVRKLLARFNAVLWEDDPKFGKLKNQIAALEEELEDIEGTTGATELPKQCESIIKTAAQLEAEGLGELVPIAQIRRAAYWSRLAPLGNHKCVIIENAENMQEGAKNSLLKILEEPPPRFTMILTSARPKSLLPTMLSRLRPYRFAARSAAEQSQVIGRIFRETSVQGMIESYLESFLPVQPERLFPLAAFFAASVAAEAVRERRTRGEGPTPLLVAFGKFATEIAEEGGMGRPASGVKEALEKVLGGAQGFETPGLFTQFLQQCEALVLAWLRAGEESPVQNGAEKTVRADLWHRELNRAAVENGSFNISPLTVMERLFEELKTGMT
jgi:DNA polymerase-3 subunit gamma/tau